MIPFSSLTPPIYIAGPITGRENENREAFEAVLVAICGHHPNRRREIHIPHDLFWPGGTGGEARRMETCLSHLCRYVEQGHGMTVVCLPDWRMSEGAVVEVALARKLKVPIYEVVMQGGVPAGVAPVRTGRILFDPDQLVPEERELLGVVPVADTPCAYCGRTMVHAKDCTMGLDFKLVRTYGPYCLICGAYHPPTEDHGGYVQPIRMPDP